MSDENEKKQGCQTDSCRWRCSPCLLLWGGVAVYLLIQAVR